MSCILCLLLATLITIFVFSPPVSGDSLPYPVLGQVTGCDGTPSFVGAIVTVMDPQTGVVKQDTVSVEGIFLVTFGNMMGPDEWYHGDPLLVWVNGTGDYGDWRGSHVTQFDKNRMPPHRVNITLSLSTPKGDTPGFVAAAILLSLTGAIFLPKKRMQA